MEMTKENIKNIKSDFQNFIKFTDEQDFIKNTYEYITANVENRTEKIDFFAFPEIIPEIKKAINEVDKGKYTERVKALKKIYDENTDYINASRKKYKEAMQTIIDYFCSTDKKQDKKRI